LADVAEEIALHGLELRSAHVMTLGRRAVDVLYLTDQQGRALDPPTTGRIVAGLMEAAAAGGGRRQGGGAVLPCGPDRASWGGRAAPTRLMRSIRPRGSASCSTPSPIASQHR